MDGESKLAELELTAEEVARLSRAFKDERFRELLREYTDEIARPENRRRYEEEIRQLELERGVDVTFIHPSPYRVLKTSVDGKQKCFINVCTNEFIGRPESAPGKGPEGQAGQHWSLPYSLSPGRHHVDSKGHTYVVYDVIFHPETLRIAGKNERFMELVDKTALQGVQKQFSVQLDENNMKLLKIKYKGVPNPSVIRKPLPWQAARGQEAYPNDLLAFPYPYDDNWATKAEKPKGGNGQDQHPDHSAPRNSAVPHYNIKYRSYIDLQDYTYTRDSSPGPRPRELVITVDLPLLKSVKDTNLNVTERHLLLQSHKPFYRLELPLPYPVDENKGEAKFNKIKGQLTVTLPVVPLQKPLIGEADGQQLVSIAGSLQGSDSDEGEKAEYEDVCCSKDSATGSSNGHNCCLLGHAAAKPSPGENSNTSGQPQEQVSTVKCREDVVDGADGNAKNENPISLKSSEPDKQADASTSMNAQCKLALCDAKECNMTVCCEENSKDKEQFGTTQTVADVEVKPLSGMSNSPDVLQSLLSLTPGGACEDDPHAQVSSTKSHGDDELTQNGEHEERLQLEDNMKTAKRDGTPADQDVEEQEGEKAKLGENELDEDDLPAKECHQERLDKNLAPIILREVNPQDGQEEVIRDHSTLSGLSFENSLLYELD
ncbi:protein kintoun [Arapaima gigas]